MYIRKEVKSTARSQGIEVMVPSGRKKKLRRKVGYRGGCRGVERDSV